MNKKRITVFALVGLISVGAALSVQAQSYPKTASHYKAKVDDFRGKKVSLDVATIKPIQKGPEAEKGLRMVILNTVDKKNRAPGGSIVAFCDEAQYDKLIDRYGTSIERPDKPGDGIDTNSLRGVLRVYEPKNKMERNLVFLDLSGGGVSLSDVIAVHAMKHGNSGQSPRIDLKKKMKGMKPGKN